MSEKPLGIVVVVGEKGHIHSEPVWKEKGALWDVLIDCWPHAVEKEVTYVYLPEKAVKFRKATPMSCLYSAIDSYMSSLLGRKLDSADKDFFNRHELTDKDGVSQPNTLRVTHEITEPYGVCVSRVRAWPGTMLSGDLAQWVKVLGMNPLAMVNRQTSNKQFCEATGLPQEDADRMFRFEFSEEPLRPAIVCGTYTEGKEGKVLIGHASYESPRAPALEHILQFQLDYRERINWEHAPVFAPIPTTEHSRELALYECLDQEGKPIYTHMATRGSLPSGSGKGSETTMVHQPRVHGLGPVGLSENRKAHDIRTCYLCYSETADRVGANLCIRCWALFLRDITCGECGNFLTANSFTSPLTGLSRRGKDWYVYVKCGWCKEKNELLCLPGTVSNAIQKAIRGEDDGIVNTQQPIRRYQNTG